MMIAIIIPLNIWFVWEYNHAARPLPLVPLSLPNRHGLSMKYCCFSIFKAITAWIKQDDVIIEWCHTRTHNNRVSIDFYVTYSKYACLNNIYLEPSSVKKVANEHTRVYIKTNVHGCPILSISPALLQLTIGAMPLNGIRHHTAVIRDDYMLPITLFTFWLIEHYLVSKSGIVSM